MRWPAGALVLAALATTGCGDDAGVRQYDSYVALGDSFTSGAGLPQTAPEATVCGNSALNYPHLVADAVQATLTDVSCGGATTDNGTQPQSQGAGAPLRPPQLDAVDRDTELVTVGLGGNDLGWYVGLMSICTSVAPNDPTGSPCAQQSSTPGNDLTALPPQIGQRVETLLTEVHRRAPGAKVLLVGYPQPVPASGTCAELPLATGDYPFVRAQWAALNDAMRAAAEQTRTTFVDVLAPSEGHDICAGADAWVNGITARPGVAAPYHPLAEGQAAVADLVVRTLMK